MEQRFADLALFTDIYAENLSDDDIELILLLQASVGKRLQISFNYNEKARKVKPLKVALFGGFWYLVGLEDEILKTFYIKKISNTQITKERFEISINISNILKNANSVWFGNESEFYAKMLLDSEIAPFFVRKPLKTQRTIETYKDGSMLIEVLANNKMQILPIVYEYLPHIVLIEPKELADEIKTELEKYFERLKE